MIKFDQQLNVNHTWGIRWLRDLSPQSNQVIPPIVNNVSLTVGPGGIRQENDKDQTVVATMSSVLGSNKLNSFRAGWTQEDVAFANPCFYENGRSQLPCEPTLNFQTFTDQQSAVAQARVNDAYQVEDTFSWFLPNKRGDHDIKFGCSTIHRPTTSQDNLNGTSPSTQQPPFNPPIRGRIPIGRHVPGQGLVKRTDISFRSSCRTSGR